MLLLFYSGMELLQGTQYYIVNQCKNPANTILTEIAYLFVLVQPLMWNYFYYVNFVFLNSQELEDYKSITKQLLPPSSVETWINT